MYRTTLQKSKEMSDFYAPLCYLADVHVQSMDHTWHSLAYFPMPDSTIV